MIHYEAMRAAEDEAQARGEAGVCDDDTTESEMFTRGPWTVGKEVVCRCPSGSPNCWHTFENQTHIFPPLGESGPVAIVSHRQDSFLIAAAPGLYAALEEFIGEVDTSVCLATHRWYCKSCGCTVKSGQAFCQTDTCVRFKSRAALAKARGEATAVSGEEKPTDAEEG